MREAREAVCRVVLQLFRSRRRCRAVIEEKFRCSLFAGCRRRVLASLAGGSAVFRQQAGAAEEE